MKKISFDTLLGLEKREMGLSEAEVAIQISRHGPNEIVEVTGNRWLELSKDTLKDPMIWFLIGIGSVFIFVGNASEAIVLFAAILPLVLMDAFLHWRTQASTAGLRVQLDSQVRVMRGDKEIRIDSRELVPGDLLAVSTGAFIPADGVFQKVEDLQVDESVLTGESFPIHKKSATFDPFDKVEAGEMAVDPNCLGLAGTRVLTGKGNLRVVFTGRRTAYGEIVQSVSNMPHERTPLQKSITQLVQWLILAAGAFCLLLAIVRLVQGHGWLDALISAATLAVAAIPEEFPVVFTFFLGVGVYRLAKRRALVRRAVSVENIGRVTYICTDKTGTITEGHLKLTHIDHDLIRDMNELDVLKAALVASNPNGADPVDQAILEKAKEKVLTVPRRLRSFPFTEDRRRETTMVLESSELVMAYMKGSPETVLLKSALTDEERRLWMERTAKWAGEGHKVIASARKKVPQGEVEVEPLGGFEFCGLLAFEDPPRREVAAAMKYCHENHIGVLMITGDHPATAAAIARDVGLGGKFPAVISAESEEMKFQEKWLDDNPRFLLGFHVVARCTPLQKLRIVEALRKAGELVAVTGDGVNDVPALKAADVGIAMGERGTRSAKEVSSIILADDNFQTIVNAIMEGRQLFSNLKKSFEYLLLFHIPFVLTAALIPMLGRSLLYLPIHVVWLELVIHPTALFAFQERARDRAGGPTLIVKRAFFSKADTVRIILIGVGFATALNFLCLTATEDISELGHTRAKAMALLTLWSAGLALYFMRLKTQASALIVVFTVLSSVLLIQLSPFLGQLHLSPLNLMDWLKSLGLVCIFILFMSLIKRMKIFS